MTSSKMSSAPCRLRQLAQCLRGTPPLRQQSVIGGHRLDDHGRDARTLAREQLL